MDKASPSSLWGLVDMGSNGIRFSITDLAPETARSLPVVFQERLGISLYDAQFSTGQKGPIPQDVINRVLDGLRRFKMVCSDFDVPEEQIKLLATEATRNAVNSQDYRDQIQSATGWKVDMLQKEDEGRIGALGVASSFEDVSGLVMDLGGGSAQLTWMTSSDGIINISPKGSVSFPYGAAAMTQILNTIDTGPNPGTDRANLAKKIQIEYLAALENLDLPPSLKKEIHDKSMSLYLSGGGFRGWGYILMSKSKKGPYPIPIINGYVAAVQDFRDVDTITAAAESALASGKGSDANIFRVSKRRAAQVPAVSFLVNAITTAFPFISDVRFCQGGVREGFLFNTLSNDMKSQSPLASATIRLSPDPPSTSHLASILTAAIPSNGSIFKRWHPETLRPPLIFALIHTMYEQQSHPKESAPLSALYLPITGTISSSHGLSHSERALLGIALCQRWGGEHELPPPHIDFLAQLQALLTKQEVWWAKYIGTIAALLGDVYPSGRVRQASSVKRIEIESAWADGLGKKGNQQGLKLKIEVRKSVNIGATVVADHVEKIEDLGKKKNRVGGKEYGFGVAVRVDVEWI